MPPLAEFSIFKEVFPPMKRLLLLFALCSLLLAPALAEQPLPFTFDPDAGVLTAYTGPGGEVIIPGQVLGQPVYKLGDALFNQNKALASVVVPEGITYIGHGAFYFNENLQSVTLPDSLQAIDAYAFFSCTSLKELRLPPNLAVIGKQAFAFLSGLERLTFTGPPPLHVGQDAFKLAQDAPNVIITVPANHQAAYEQLLGLPCQPGPDAQPLNILADEGELEVDAATGTLTRYSGRAAAVELPQQTHGVPLRAIGPGAFDMNRSLMYLAVPEGVEALGEKSLRSTSLMAIRLPDSLRRIDKEALSSNSKLAALTLPEGLQEIGPRAFFQTQLKEIRLPLGIASVPEGAFANCTWLENALLPGTVEAIGPAAFKGCSALTYLVIDRETLPQIAPDALEGTKIADVDIAATATKAQEDAAREALNAMGIQTNVWRANEADQAPYPPGDVFTFDAATGLAGNYTGSQTELSSFWNFHGPDGLVDITGLAEGTFRGSAVTRFDMPRSNEFTTIGKEAFADSQLKEIRLFDSLTTVEEGAFRNCTNLTKIVLPDSVTVIGPGAFAGCTGLEQLVFPASAQVAPDAFQGVDPAILRATAAATDEQLAHQAEQLGLPWYQGLLRVGEVSTLPVMPDSYTPNAESDFEFDAPQGKITKYIGTSPDVVIPRSIGGVPVRSIGYPGFSNLTVQSVAQGEQDNKALRSVVIPETVQEIADSAFLNCTALERVLCYGPITRLGIRAFEQCESLREVAFLGGLREVDLYAFHMCAALTTVDLGDKLLTIGEGAFQKCAGLTQLRIPASVTAIGEGAFMGCDALEALCFERADTAIFAGANTPLPVEAKQLRLYLPLDTDDETLQAFQTYANQALMRTADIVQRGGCPFAVQDALAPEQPTPEQPTATPATQAPVVEASAAPIPATTAPQPPAEQAAALTDYVDKMLVCIKAEAAGMALDPAVIGRYDVRFGTDGQAVMTISGAAMPASPWRQEGNTLVVDYYGTLFVFEPAEGGLQLNYYDAMLLTYAPE